MELSLTSLKLWWKSVCGWQLPETRKWVPRESRNCNYCDSDHGLEMAWENKRGESSLHVSDRTLLIKSPVLIPFMLYIRSLQTSSAKGQSYHLRLCRPRGLYCQESTLMLGHRNGQAVGKQVSLCSYVFGSSGVWIHGLARQVLYHLSHAPGPIALVIFQIWSWALFIFIQASLRLWSFYLFLWQSWDFRYAIPCIWFICWDGVC
jgi:hypothetical protein